jgi:phage tail sheath protein FI
VPTSYLTPGVYYERVDASPPAIAAIRTDVAGFVGLAPRGPVDVAVPVQSFRQFQAHFGDFTGSGYLAYAVRGFFENGGRRCWVVRVASRDPVGGLATAGVMLRSTTGADVWRIAAYSPGIWGNAANSPGVWGNGLSLVVQETHRAQTLSDPRTSLPEYSVVGSITGFGRGVLARITQGAAPPVWKVVSDIDPATRRLIWLSPDAAARLPYDSPLLTPGFDPDRPLQIESVEYTLIVRQGGVPIEFYEGLSLIPEHPKYGPEVIGPLPIPNGTDAAQTLPAAPRPIVIEEQRAIPLPQVEALDVNSDISLPFTGGADGLMLLTAYDFIGEEISPYDSDEARAQKRRGLRVLAEVEEVAMLAIPDIHIQPITPPATAPLPPCVPNICLPIVALPPEPPLPPPVIELPPIFGEEDIYRVQAAMVQQCEARRDRIALLDPPFATARTDALGVGAVRAWRSRFESKYAALYYPWLRVVDPLRVAPTRPVPPSGHVAGQYAENDFAVGVHKAPANVLLDWVQDVTVPIDDGTHGILNPLGINAIRSLPGRGLRIYGARTVSSDPDWRYVNVRRLLMMIEKAIDRQTQWAVFEPNNELTQAKLRLALTGFLIALWQRGALVGDTAQEAFFVKCDEETNPPAIRDQGQLVALVGVAPSQPFEFVILRVGRADNQFEITELSGGIGMR